MSSFLDPLELEYVDGKKWKLTTEFDYRLGAIDGPEAVHVPKGFLTDFASVPRLLWNIFPPTGGYGKAAVIHDFLYQYRLVKWERPAGTLTRLVERGEADAILNEGMEVLGVGRVTRWMIYRGVRVGGWVAWRNYRKAESCPIPSVEPPSPTV
jgi:hypothetical protein